MGRLYIEEQHTMRLIDIELELQKAPIPPDIARLLDDARQRIDALEDKSRAAMPAFVPSDFELVHHALTTISASNLVTGRRFLEWGSGIGVITCLAVKAGFDAVGIEIERPLVDIADEIARVHGVDCQFACGSLIPPGAEPEINWSSDVAWLTTEGLDGYDELELDPEDFDLVFAYPWPGEEQVIFDLFRDYAATGALLLTYHGVDGLRLQRKIKR
jgi:hypothetical protein